VEAANVTSSRLKAAIGNSESMKKFTSHISAGKTAVRLVRRLSAVLTARFLSRPPRSVAFPPAPGSPFLAQPRFCGFRGLLACGIQRQPPINEAINQHAVSLPSTASSPATPSLNGSPSFPISFAFGFLRGAASHTGPRFIDARFVERSTNPHKPPRYPRTSVLSRP
jgi:hypothetical protein